MNDQPDRNRMADPNATQGARELAKKPAKKKPAKKKPAKKK